MKFFKKQEEKKGCSCGGTCDSESMERALKKKKQGARMKVLGTGCAKCRALENSVMEALQELELPEEVDHVSDFSEIASYGVMSTPALVIDGNVVSFGKVLHKDEVINLLKEAGF